MESKHIVTMTSTTVSQHLLSDKWVLYAHLPHDTNWDIDSYKSVLHFKSVEETLCIFEALPDIMINNCMLFLMRGNIKPIWEDESNRYGGCFSFKISNPNVTNVWKSLSYTTVGNTLSSDTQFMNDVNGITISPKKNFCIVKIWMKTCDHSSIDSIIDISCMNKKDVLFKKHIPEY